MSSKLRQCQKFVETVRALVESSTSSNNLPTKIEVTDMGCGRGYLTFSLHHYFATELLAKGDVDTHLIGNVRTIGIDVRPKLIAEMNQIANSLGYENSLVFEEGTIEGRAIINGEVSESLKLSDDEIMTCADSSTLKILIALHACDTATDDALWSGISTGTDILVVAPCCHKEVRKQLDTHVRQTKQTHFLKDILRHGIYRERVAETVTDSMRALLLEIANYQVQVFEFIGGEHTSKNVMITAVKKKRSRSAKERSELKGRLRSLAALHGVRQQRLAMWMKEDLADDNDLTSVEQRKAERSTNSMSRGQMPPI
jgi:hypothetical protein